MPSITISTFATYSRKRTGTATGTATGTNAATAAANAKTAGNSATLTWGSWANTSDTGLGTRFGVQQQAREVTITGATSSSPFTADWKATQNQYNSQTKCTFTVPTGLKSSEISSATLTFTTNSADTVGTNFNGYVCGPNKSSSNPTSYLNPTNTSSYYSTKTSFKGKGTAGATYTVTVTNQFKHCLDVGRYWLMITPTSQTLTGTNYARITGATITYVLNNSIRIVNGSNLDQYKIYVVDTDGTTLVPCTPYIYDGTNLIKYS